MARIGAIILAAGGSNRLEQAKQLLEAKGETLVHSAVRAAREGACTTICVVTGEHRERVEQAVADFHSIIARTETGGAGSAVRSESGCKTFIGKDVSAVVLLACDQPALTAAVVRALIVEREKKECAIVASHYAAALAVPALLDKTCWPQLLKLPDASGAKSIIESDASRVASVEFDGGAVDIDTPANLAEFLQGKRWALNFLARHLDRTPIEGRIPF